MRARAAGVLCRLLHAHAECGPPAPLVEVRESWGATEHSEVRRAVLRDLVVLGGFVSEKEEESLMRELEPRLRRMRYEYDHWDNAIHGFRETERSSWLPENGAVLERVRAAAFPPGSEPLQHTHVLDLAPLGHIKPHVDAVRFCGGVIAGVSLLSDAVMRLVHSQHPHLALDALLPRRSLYIMRESARYDFTHEVLSNEASEFRGRPVHKRRRVSVICRSAPDPARQ